MKLDRTRPYGEIFGGADGAKYVQDDATFDADGNPISIQLPKETDEDDPIPNPDGRKRRGRKAAV